MIRPLVLIASILLPLPALAHTAAAQSAAPPNVAPAHGASTAETPTDPLPRRAGPIGVRLGAPTEGRLIIDAVLEGGPADRAGLAAGDSILSLGGSPVSGRESLSAAMRGLRGGQVVSVEISRGGATLAKQLQLDEAQRETVEGCSVHYGSVAHPDGYRLRTIVTEPTASPRAAAGKLPALLYVQGIVCDSIDRPGRPEAFDTRLVHAMAKAGFVTMRVDKPGLGDSEGPACSEIDLTTELEACTAALRQLASLPNVDPERIYLFGHSMGGVLAPLLSADTPVRGIMVYGTLARSWFEYQLENVRRQSELAGLTPAQVTASVQAEARSSAMILIEKKSLGDVWQRWPELRQPAQGIMLDETHMSTRHMRFFHELQDLNIAEAWEKSSGSVLAIWGEYDWVSSREDHERIAEIVNAREDGAGSVLTMPKADHAFTTHATFLGSRMSMGEGAWDEDLPRRMLEWIDAVEGGTRAPWQEVQPTQAELDALADSAIARADRQASLQAWTALATDPYPGKQDDIFFVTPALGFYGNGAGRIFRTKDGGATWEKVFEQKGTFVRCLAFADEKHGVMGNIGPGYFPGVTDEIPIYRTEDGGTTWTPVTAIEGAPVVGLCAFDIVEVPFINAGVLDHRPRIVGVGRVGGPAAYIWSDDLGKSWKQGKIPAPGAMAFDVKFLDEKRGFIAAASHADVAQANALILATEDGGATWTEVYRSTRPFETTWKLSFPTASVGYCTVQSYNPDPTASQRFVAKTTDGGKTWAEIPLVDDHKVREFGIAFVDEDLGWVGAMPHGFGTTDGGKTWEAVDFGNAVNKIRLIRDNDGVTGYAIGVEIHKLVLPSSAPAPTEP